MIIYRIAEVIDLPDGTIKSTIVSNIDSFTFILQYIMMIQYTITKVIDLPDGTIASTIINNIDSFIHNHTSIWQ